MKIYERTYMLQEQEDQAKNKQVQLYLTGIYRSRQVVPWNIGSQVLLSDVMRL